MEVINDDLNRYLLSVAGSGERRVTFCIEGNIGVGKSTFLRRIADETLNIKNFVEIVPEPVADWQNVGSHKFNLLDAFYMEPQRYAYTFQNFVFVTRVMQERRTASGAKPLRLMERSIFSDKMVFVRAVHEANWMDDMEVSVYDSWFNPIISCFPEIVPDGFIYLRASPETCYQRLKLRRRMEESGITLDYLRNLHDKHEKWLSPCEGESSNVPSASHLSLNKDSHLCQDIRDHVLYLKNGNLHPSIQEVPVLIIDCELDHDFDKDVEAKYKYARQLSEFFLLVKKEKERAGTFGSEGGSETSK